MGYFTKHIFDFSFDGRAFRKEFWLFYLFYVIYFYAILFGAAFLLSVVHEIVETDTTLLLTVILVVIMVIIGLPGLTMQGKRLHDSGLSANWLLLHFIPTIGTVILIILLCRKTQLQNNKYGPIPEEIAWKHNLYTCESDLVQKDNLKVEAVLNQEEANEGLAYKKLASVGTCAPMPQKADEQVVAPFAVAIPKSVLQVRFCRNCGKALASDSNFCSNCGTKVLKEW